MKKYSLAALQMGYLGAKLEKETEGERCSLCWDKHCNHANDIKNDPFINLTTASEYKYA